MNACIEFLTSDSEESPEASDDKVDDAVDNIVDNIVESVVNAVLNWIKNNLKTSLIIFVVVVSVLAVGWFALAKRTPDTSAWEDSSSSNWIGVRMYLENGNSSSVKVQLQPDDRLATRKDMGNAMGDLERKFEEANAKHKKKLKELEQTLSNTIPIGFIYTQLPGTKSPFELWPLSLWVDISANYAGVFFRVAGGGAAGFGAGIQEGSSPRITHFTTFHDGPEVDMGSPGSSQKTIAEGARFSNMYLNGIEFKFTGGEVRPRNVAIRIWIRILGIPTG